MEKEVQKLPICKKCKRRIQPNRTTYRINGSQVCKSCLDNWADGGYKPDYLKKPMVGPNFPPPPNKPTEFNWLDGGGSQNEDDEKDKILTALG